jgi:hypothetical protein
MTNLSLILVRKKYPIYHNCQKHFSKKCFLGIVFPFHQHLKNNVQEFGIDVSCAAANIGEGCMPSYGSSKAARLVGRSSSDDR